MVKKNYFKANAALIYLVRLFSAPLQSSTSLFEADARVRVYRCRYNWQVMLFTRRQRGCRRPNTDIVSRVIALIHAAQLLIKTPPLADSCALQETL